MRREVIAGRLRQAARLGHQHGQETGQVAARGLANLGAAAVAVALLLLTMVVVTALWFLLLYAWFILLGGMLGELSAVWGLLSACWPFFAALGVLLLILRLCWLPVAPPPELGAVPRDPISGRLGEVATAPLASGAADQPRLDGSAAVARPQPISSPSGLACYRSQQCSGR